MTGISSSLVIPYTCRGLANPIKNIHSNNPWLNQYSLCFYVLPLAHNTWHYLQLQMRRLTNDSKRHTNSQGFSPFIFPRDIAPRILVTKYLVSERYDCLNVQGRFWRWNQNFPPAGLRSAHQFVGIKWLLIVYSVTHYTYYNRAIFIFAVLTSIIFIYSHINVRPSQLSQKLIKIMCGKNRIMHKQLMYWIVTKSDGAWTYSVMNCK